MIDEHKDHALCPNILKSIIMPECHDAIVHEQQFPKKNHHNVKYSKDWECVSQIYEVNS